MKSPILAAATLALAFALPVGSGTAAAQEAEAAPAEAEAAPAKEKKICRSYKVTGSLTRRTRVCRTEAEWNQEQATVQRGVSDMQNSGSGGKVCHPDPSDPFQGCPG